jgi:hypothetical protein
MAISESSDSLPLADVFRAANGLAAGGLIADWALGGALAAEVVGRQMVTLDTGAHRTIEHDDVIGDGVQIASVGVGVVRVAVGHLWLPYA